MPTCERCWEQAWVIANTGPARDQADVYRELLLKNDCTPEQQAGRHATVCGRCVTKTVHQHAGQCIACGWLKPRASSSSG